MAKSKKKPKKGKSKLKTKSKSETIKNVFVDGQLNDSKSKIWIDGEWIDLDESRNQPYNVHAGSSLASFLNEEETEDKPKQQVKEPEKSWIDYFFAIFGFKRK